MVSVRRKANLDKETISTKLLASQTPNHTRVEYHKNRVTKTPEMNTPARFPFARIANSINCNLREPVRPSVTF